MAILKINGQVKNFDSENFPETISQLLMEMNIAEETVVAEVDGEIIERSNFKTKTLKPQSSIELIRFVGGG